MAVLYPSVRSVEIKCSAPSVIFNSLATRSRALSSSPSSRATRARKLSLKSISPRMARSVIALTCSPTPASLANSSITSASISVESISNATSLRVRRYILSCWNARSTSNTPATSSNSLRKTTESRIEPRAENSTQALLRAGGSPSGIRPDKRLMLSILRPCLDITAVTRAIWSEVILRAKSVMM